MYIEQGYKGNRESWVYLVGLLLIFLGWQVIGMIPLMAALVIKSLGSGPMPMDVSGMSKLLGSNLFLFLMLLSFAFGLLATFITVKYIHKQSIVSLTTSRKRIDWKRVFYAFGLWAGITIIVLGIDVYLSPEDYQLNFKLVPFLILCVIAILFIPLQTSFEEYFMRGYLMQGIGIVVGNKWVPLVVTSLIFGLLHLFNPEVDKLGYGIMVYYIGTGFFLGIITLMDEGLELALGFHAANNLLTALLVTADWTAFQTESIYLDVSEPKLGWDVFVPVLVIYPILIYVFSKKYNWHNWKERLTGKVLLKEEYKVLEENGPKL
ncbi:CPBP family intramembrane glutamic endopeptidase [Arenibacter latericius]|uniref:CPBP family intramembrane glutamic endopeptidase n=1 Tax=Arenibacter latericius TaxID=86104 RepID=UPI00041A261A|nr:type II CAAX endopeptidase family protein [Arenibacter latericius]MDX1362636.1 type II CAAX endopeptidase family protein [Arenibacter latericius]